ncbi:AAA family ATPase [Acidianus manzaensis]|uniref:Endonuclease GajA/Old nuclease/RecF-like AAA domain-containing protein n=1 Tax=Acidianus manzaensis TaxID=282676 RepID=A0A1W6JWX8_9CREN|nr:AAA family ATPase [Acidianus manzaensis]ARM74749.1 hypothetical protein B6F84_01055 [Acidianus manzaensis]
MITSISINNFRGIKELNIENFGDINVFIGRNNTGKSSILEALYLTSLTDSLKDPIIGKDSIVGGDKISYLLTRRETFETLDRPRLSNINNLDPKLLRYNYINKISITLKEQNKEISIREKDISDLSSTSTTMITPLIY